MTRSRPAIRSVFFLMLAGPILLFTGCGSGFEAVKSGKNDDILYIVNSDIRASTVPQFFEPVPIPVLPPGAAAKSAPPPSGSPQQVVSSENSAGKLKPAADGVVDLADQSVLPYNRVGRLEMDYPSNKPGTVNVCTGQLIGDSGVVLTAAHCIYNLDKREWTNDVSFNLGYNQGSVVSRFDWECVAMVSGWPNGNYAYDFAFVKLRGSPPRGLGMTINKGGTRVDAVGYPDNYYDNERLVHVTGIMGTGNPAQMPGNRLGHGSSGGAWIAELTSGSFDAIGLNSFRYTNDLTSMYGPKLSSTTLKLYEFTRRGCRDQITMTGERTIEMMAAGDMDEFDNVIYQSQADLSAGSYISLGPDSSCGCGGEAYFAENATAAERLIGIRILTTDDESTGVQVENQYTVVGPSSRKFLGCVKQTSSSGVQCALDRQVRLSSDRLATKENQEFPKMAKGITFDEAMVARDINSCIASCENKDKNVCLDLGKGALYALAPLAKFTSDVENAPVGDGVVVKKDSIILEYDGDPTTSPDICERSDIKRRGSEVINDGWGCIFTTKAVTGASLKTRLHMRANLLGRPSGWSASLGPLSESSVTYFPLRELAPSIDFEGSTAFNNRYAGDVYASARVSDDRLVVSTSNGCITGLYK